ncbi:ORFS372W, partial [Human betaherpesvirus 5]
IRTVHRLRRFVHRRCATRETRA